MEKEIVQKKLVVLKPSTTQEEIEDIANKKKSGLFGSVFSRPKQEDIEVSSIELYFEPVWRVKGSYNIDFYRKNTYELSTDPYVKEILIGSGVFPVRTESGTWKKLKDSMKVGEKKNKLDLPVEEHVEYDLEEELYINGQGKEIEFNYKFDSKNIENFPDDFLKSNKEKIRDSEFSESQAVDVLLNVLKEDIGNDVRIVKEKLIVEKLEQVYLPVYEVRCVDPKNKVKILRIDGINSKIL